MIEKIRPVADDVNVAVRKVYGKANDAYAYYDSACKNKVTCAELQDAYIKGLMIDVAGTLYKPVSCCRKCGDCYICDDRFCYSHNSQTCDS